MKLDFLAIAERLLIQPAIAYHESAVSAEIESICREAGLHLETDRFGNLIVSIQARAEGRQLCLVAHMDHPGFRIKRQLGRVRFAADFRGGVPAEFFKKDSPLIVMPGRIPAKLMHCPARGKMLFTISTGSIPVEKPRFAVWKLPEFRVSGDRLIGRACDDLVGVASILMVLARLKKSRSRANVIGLITRAEEVGFHGTLAAIAGKSIRSDAFVISLETSREIPPVQMGEGVIIRVGDRASVFDSAGTRFLAEIATDLKKRDEKFKYQRALMSGGTCEATAFMEAGYQTAAVCVSLGNYHNCAAKQKIGAEYVSIRDAESMIQLLVEAAKKLPRIDQFTGRLSKRLEKLSRRAVRELKKSF